MASDVASPPYDVVDAAEARRLAEPNPRHFLRVTRAELELAPGTASDAPEAMERAAENFDRFQKEGWLVRDEAAGLFFYRQVRGGHVQTGVAAVCHVGDYTENIILKHERTRQKPEDERTRHILATGAQTGPVFLAYRDRPEVDALAAAATAAAPLCDFVAPDGIRHTLWRALDPAALADAFAAVPRAYIADGHHRAAAAARAARERAAARGGPPAEAESDWFLAVLFPASHLQILPYNRCVRDLNGRTPESLMDEVRAIFDVENDAPPLPDGPGRACMFLAQEWSRLSWPPPGGVDPVAALDVSVLQDRLLGPVLGIDDPRQSERIAFVGGIHGTAELERRVRERQMAVAFSLHPVTIQQLMAVSDAGLTMPPKSTWFEPKLRDGLVVHTLDD